MEDRCGECGREFWLRMEMEIRWLWRDCACSCHVIVTRKRVLKKAAAGVLLLLLATVCMSDYSGQPVSESQVGRTLDAGSGGGIAISGGAHECKAESSPLALSVGDC